MDSEISKPTNVGSNDQLGQVPERAKVGDAPLCEQMQALQARAMKLHPIDLHDPQLDTADPYTRLFLLAEYWQRQAKEARARLDDALFVLGMVDKNNRIDAGETGKAWSGRFVAEEVRRVIALGPNVRGNRPARGPQE